MMNKQTQTILEQAIRKIVLGPDSGNLDVDFDEESEAWTTSIELEDASGESTVFSVDFEYAESEEDPPYLLLTWIVFPADELPKNANKDLKCLELVNALNGEAGCKFLIEDDGEGNSNFLCQVDVPVELFTQELLQRAFERSRDIVAAYFEDIRDALA